MQLQQESSVHRLPDLDDTQEIPVVSDEAKDRIALWRERSNIIRDVSGALALAVIPIFCIKVLLMAGYDETVALAIVSNSSINTILTGTLSSLSAILVPVAIAVGVYYSGKAFSIKHASTYMWLIFTPSLRNFRHGLVRRTLPSKACELFSSVIVASLIFGTGPGGIFFASAYFLFRKGVLAGRTATSFEWGMRLWFILYGAFVAYYAMFAPWLPPEVVQVDGKPRTVNVLSATTDSVVVFDVQRKVVLRVSGPALKTRQFCRSLSGPSSTDPRPQCPK
ncbi:MAG TPA: hypothetical protein VNV66_05230 [Pilimelia sp.]|nr:hypothetical protein [Pilimelia sp.]